MANISNKIRCKLMNKMFHGEDVTQFAKANGIGEKVLQGCKTELTDIVGEDFTISDGLTDHEVATQKNKFKKNSWKVIDKANQIIIDKLSAYSSREKRIDELLSEVEICLESPEYDKTQMGKLIRILDGLKQNNIAELARVIHIFYDKQDDNTDIQSNETLEKLLVNLEGDVF